MQSRDLTNNPDMYAANTERLNLTMRRRGRAPALFADNRISEGYRDSRACLKDVGDSRGNLSMRHIRYQPTPAHRTVQSVPIRAKSIRLRCGSWEMTNILDVGGIAFVRPRG